MKFSELFSGATSRAEVVCTFLALLELIRLQAIGLRADRRILGKLKSRALRLAAPAGGRRRRAQRNEFIRWN